MNPSDSAAWYAALQKPWFAPPAMVFGPVWTVLYTIIAVTFLFVAWQALRGRLPRSVWLPFALNLVFNLAYTPLQFGLKDNLLALVDIVLVLGTLVWALRAVSPYHRWVAVANMPYLAWVGFATVLQASIAWLNL